MPSIRILKNTVCGGKVVRTDQVVNASDADAKILIGAKKAVRAEAVEAPAEQEVVSEKVQQTPEEPKKRKGRPKG